MLENNIQYIATKWAILTVLNCFWLVKGANRWHGLSTKNDWSFLLMLKLMDGVLLVSTIDSFDALIIDTKMYYSNISLLLILLAIC